MLSLKPSWQAVGPFFFGWYQSVTPELGYFLGFRLQSLSVCSDGDCVMAHAVCQCPKFVGRGGLHKSSFAPSIQVLFLLLLSPRYAARAMLPCDVEASTARVRKPREILAGGK